jgi:hypothetical protein
MHAATAGRHPRFLGQLPPKTSHPGVARMLRLSIAVYRVLPAADEE